MKSKTSFFNGAAFRKDMTRFSPLWGGYILCLMLGLFLLAQGGLDYSFVHNLSECIQVMGLVNCGYDLLVAQLLFGDLYNSRMCNALHALPLRRECWFGTHIASGLAMSLIPTAVMTAVSLVLMAFSSMVNGWQIPLYWMLAANLEYLFFFGVAVFSTFCAGNRLAMAVVYGFLNFASFVAYYLINILYIPLLHGVVLQDAPYLSFCPVAKIANEAFIHCEYHTVFSGYSAEGFREYTGYGTFEVMDTWWYLWVIAAVGIALSALGLVLYRRRKLECAGDFLATKKLEPVFMVLFSICTACAFQIVTGSVLGYGYDGNTVSTLVFLGAGLAAGWFAGRMLVERNARVFRKPKNWLGLLALTLAVGVSLVLTKADIFGIEDWVPQKDQVERAWLTNYSIYGRNPVMSGDSIDDVLRVHELALEDKLTYEQASADRQAAYAEYEEATMEIAEDGTVRNDYSKAKLRDYKQYSSVTLTYQMKDGRRVQREYFIMVDTEEGELVKRHYSREAYLLWDQIGWQESDSLLALVAKPERIHVEGVPVDDAYLTEEAVEALFRAISADCAAGTMAQNTEFHKGAVFEEGEAQLREYWIDIQIGLPVECGFSLNIYADSANTLAWLESTGVLEEVHAQVVEGSKYG